MRLVAAVGLGALAAAAGCGGGGATGDSRAASDVCAPGLRAAQHVVERGVGLVVCRLEARGELVRVRVDTLPQAYRRWSASEVERWQNTAGWRHIPAQQPVPVPDLGVGAYWIPGSRELAATDGARLVTIDVLRAAGSPRALAVRVVRAVLAGAPPRG